MFDQLTTRRNKMYLSLDKSLEHDEPIGVEAKRIKRIG